MAGLSSTRAARETTGHRISSVAAVLGVLGVLGSWLGWTGILWGTPAVVVGHIAQRREKVSGRPWWTTGLVAGYLGVVIGTLVVVLAGMLLAAPDDPAD